MWGQRDTVEGRADRREQELEKGSLGSQEKVAPQLVLKGWAITAGWTGKARNTISEQVDNHRTKNCVRAPVPMPCTVSMTGESHMFPHLTGTWNPYSEHQLLNPGLLSLVF